MKVQHLEEYLKKHNSSLRIQFWPVEKSFEVLMQTPDHFSDSEWGDTLKEALENLSHKLKVEGAVR